MVSNCGGEWSALPQDLTIEHQQPEKCPIATGQGEQLTVGGALVETPAPTFPNDGKTGFMHLTVYQTYNVGQFTGSGILDQNSDSFGYAAGSGSDWQAQVFLTYNMGHNPDWMEFRVTCLAPVSCLTPKAWVEIQNTEPE
jgi:hypothetical protein